MPTSILRAPGVLLGLLLVGGALLTARPTSAHLSRSSADCSERTVQPPAVSDTSDVPAVDPYTTNRSLAYHVLAAPAYVLHGITRPIGWGVKYLEQNYPNLFEPKRPPRGIVPLVELGGPTRFLGGLALYDNHLRGGAHSARLEGLYGGPNAFETAATYQFPTPFGPGTNFKTAVNFFSNPENKFYVGGNSSDLNADETFFRRRQLDVTVSFRAAASTQTLTGGVDLLYEHVNATTGDNLQGERLDAANSPGLGTVDLLTSRVLLGLNRTRGQPRASGGTEVLLQLDYSHDLTADRFRYGRYVAEVRQYLPLGFLPDTRRLALRARLEQVEPLFEGSAVPFYQWPSLGGKRTLRGFRSYRFQNRGSLLFSAEYRYPLWSNVDAVFLVDSGQVFSDLADVSTDRLHWSYGGGLHLLNDKGVGARLEVAGSTEGLRIVVTTDPSFQRLAR